MRLLTKLNFPNQNKRLCTINVFDCHFILYFTEVQLSNLFRVHGSYLLVLTKNEENDCLCKKYAY